MKTLAKRMLMRMLEGIQGSELELVSEGRTHRFGDSGSNLRARLVAHNERFFVRALKGGDTGMGESYMDGDWSSPDLVSLVRLAVRNSAALERSNGFFASLSLFLNNVRRRLRKNTIAGSRRNIQAHYDLSNDFFRLFLDRRMLYSCGWYETPQDSLETAQFQKIDRICRKLQLQPGDHVLEIGTGWGGFALHAAREYGCRVTTTTISKQQYNHAKQLFESAGMDGQIQLLLEDYRLLTGQYDKIVSIEMFEAIGFEHYDDYFAACNRLLKPDGSMLLQTITMNEQRFLAYVKQSDWIQKYIFPGAQLASVRGILDSLASVTSLSMFHCEDMGTHYARTLAAWRERFHRSLSQVRELGFDERFIRMWDYYLAFCEGAFLERHISDVQLMLTKNYNPKTLFQEPWLQQQRSVERRGSLVEQ